MSLRHNGRRDIWLSVKLSSFLKLDRVEKWRRIDNSPRFLAALKIALAWAGHVICLVAFLTGPI